MLTRWTLENFKPIRERLDLPTAPLTVLAGLNSSGKSSFLQSILLIAQTLANQKLDEPLVLNGSIVRFGTFQDVCNDRAKGPQIRIGFTLTGSTGGNASSPSRSSLPADERDTQPPLSISMDVQFEGVTPKEEEGHGLQAVRAVLSSVEMISFAPMRSARSDAFRPLIRCAPMLDGRRRWTSTSAGSSSGSRGSSRTKSATCTLSPLPSAPSWLKRSRPSLRRRCSPGT